MPTLSNLVQMKEKIRQALEKLGESLVEGLDAWLNKRRPYAQPIPIPIDQPQRKKRQAIRHDQ